jgi:D-glycero-alpha-D-manno-heptose-7-phosphate kinase
MIDDKIVITRTPLRISFIGGGTDMPYFYYKNGGATISCTINRYIYVTVKFHNNYQEKYRLNYSETENVNNLEKIKNLRIKLVIKRLEIKKPLYINTFADLPANSGLGSSSSFTVGLIKALAKLDNQFFSVTQLAEMAYEIEAKITNNSLGKQDHYIAAYGGFNYIKYLKNNILISPISLKQNELDHFEKSISLIWTGKSRTASTVLDDQKKNFKKNLVRLKQINILSQEFTNEIKKNNINIKKIGKIINQSWELKKNLSKFVTNNNINTLYKILLKFGSYGGKLLGAGNGGFILSLSSQSTIRKIKKKLKKNKILQVKIEKSGSVFL